MWNLNNQPWVSVMLVVRIRLKFGKTIKTKVVPRYQIQ